MLLNLISVVVLTYPFLHLAFAAECKDGASCPQIKTLNCPSNRNNTYKAWKHPDVDGSSSILFDERYDERSNRSFDQDYRNISAINNTAYGPLKPPQCGLSTVVHPRVMGGTPSPLGAWPWLALLGYCTMPEFEPEWSCAGALISARHVLTAGHCVLAKSKLYMVRLGEHDLSTDTEGAYHLDVLIETAIVHPAYGKSKRFDDIAILRLAEDVQFTPQIRPICLPATPEMRANKFERSFPYFAGWGRIAHQGAVSNRLLEIQVPVVNIYDCRTTYERFKNLIFDSRVLCAGYKEGGKDACTGDSGGPLMLPVDGHFYIIGLAIRGLSCGVPNYPGIYDRIGHYMGFIMEHLV